MITICSLSLTRDIQVTHSVYKNYYDQQLRIRTHVPSTMKPISIAFVLCMVFCASQAQDPVGSSNDLLYKVVNECFHQDYSKCIKQNVLSYLNTQVPQEPSSRQVDPERS
ncbi:hypothetical protein WDU94_002672 [Cyamophila willieti]